MVMINFVIFVYAIAIPKLNKIKKLLPYVPQHWLQGFFISTSISFNTVGTSTSWSQRSI